MLKNWCSESFFWEEWELTLTMTNPTDAQQKRKATFRPPTSKTQWRHRNLQQRNRGHGRCREGPELYRRRDPIHVIKEKQKSFSSKTVRTHRTSLDVSLKATCLWATLSWQPNICIRLYFCGTVALGCFHTFTVAVWDKDDSQSSAAF